ncbi:hypothetical protein NE536_22460 [Shewanella sp. SP1W3]|uniref:Uncharacterized protein n=1 Tax=Shewanella septentrionalis TaxID=2952223 RepID=A0A9X3B3Y3_9GAMM|nr:hypothetical protein [Shewanella septentrionalis]
MSRPTVYRMLLRGKK